MELDKGTKKSLGVDVGGVILRRHPFDRKVGAEKAKNAKNAKNAKKAQKGKGEMDKEKKKKEKGKESVKDVDLIEGALGGLEHLSKRYTLFIVSFCKEKMEAASRKKLRLAGVLAWIPEERWVFVRDRKDKVKVLKKYGMAGLIDDRCDVLDSLADAPIPYKRFWFGGDDKTKGHIIVKDWEALRKIL